MWLQTLAEIAIFATIVGVFLTIAAWINGRRTTNVLKKVLAKMEEQAERRHKEAEEQAERRHKEAEEQAEKRHKETKEILTKLVLISEENQKILRDNQKILQIIEERSRA